MEGVVIMKKVRYEKPMMFADTFVANQYVAACAEAYTNIEPTQVQCISKGHTNTQYTTMFLDEQTACIVKFNPGVGQAKDDKFYTQFEACAYVDGCNKQNWSKQHPNDKNFKQHAELHGTPKGDKDGFIFHDTVIDLSQAEKFQLS